MHKQKYSKLLYLFIFINALISGIFGIFLPVYLFDIGFLFSEVSFFIAISSFSYFLSLFILERIISKFTIKKLMIFTFIAYSLMISIIYLLAESRFFLLMVGILSGIYLSFFLIIQRLLFLNSIEHSNIGEKFANIQIFVLLVSQIAILLGSYILENFDFKIVYSLSIILLFFSIILISKGNVKNLKFEEQKQAYSVMTLNTIFNFTDKYNSKFIFSIDGIFLYLETYFWLLVIFLFLKSNFLSAGIMIILVTLVFYIFYLFIRRIVDKSNLKILFKMAVVFYSLSWILRFFFDLSPDDSISYLLIIIIGFLSMFFRLVYNKAFFKIAKETILARYIFLKSYYSQFFISCSFLIFGLLFLLFDQSEQVFKGIFLAFSLLTFLYLYQKI